MPDYELCEWNESTFDIESAPEFVRSAYAERKWAFVADYVRFYACYHRGGIYLDTDVEVYRRFDVFLHHGFFAGTEVRGTSSGEPFTTMDASCFGCVAGHWFARRCLEFYDTHPFRESDGEISGGVVQVVATRALEPYGYVRRNIEQHIADDICIYSTEYFTNKENAYDRSTIYSVHFFDGSWTDSSKRGWLFRFCRRHDMMHIYRWLESLRPR